MRAGSNFSSEKAYRYYLSHAKSMTPDLGQWRDGRGSCWVLEVPSIVPPSFKSIRFWAIPLGEESLSTQMIDDLNLIHIVTQTLHRSQTSLLEGSICNSVKSSDLHWWIETKEWREGETPWKAPQERFPPCKCFTCIPPTFRTES